MLTSSQSDPSASFDLLHGLPTIRVQPESIDPTEWSLPVVLKHGDNWLYMITSKRSTSKR